MSHPEPTRDYSDKHREETMSEWRSRRRTALGKNAAQRSSGKWLKEAGKSFRRKGESPVEHLKRLLSSESKTKALRKKMSPGDREKIKTKRRELDAYMSSKKFSDMSGAENSGDR